jgi:hypothetical protein
MFKKSSRQMFREVQRIHWKGIGLGLDPLATDQDDLDTFHLSEEGEPDFTWEEARQELYRGNSYE